MKGLIIRLQKKGAGIRAFMGSKLPFDHPWKKRFSIYAVLSFFIGFIALMISFFNPVSLIAHLIVGLGYSLVFGSTALVLSEVRIAVRTKQGKGTDFTVGEFWGTAFLVFVAGFYLLGDVQLIVKSLETGFFTFYFQPENGFLAFSWRFYLKMVPVFIVDGFFVLFYLKRQEKSSVGKKIYIKAGKKEHVFFIKEISHISVQEHYASVFVKKDRQFIKNEIKLSLVKVLNSIDNPDFIRVHRSHAVNLNRVTGLEKDASGAAYALIENNDIRLPVSRRCLAPLRQQYQKIHGVPLCKPARQSLSE